MIKTNIKMRVTPEQSRKVQEICFSKNIMWAESRDTVKLTGRPFLYIYEDCISSCDSENHFKISTPKEIDADLFIKTNGTCEETYIAKYTSQPKDLESALKKIENLHIALNKKVDKNKNQALEITKLLEQKKDLQDKLNQANRVVALTINNSSNLVDCLDKKDEIIKEKDTIISYLESKLK